jgi:hypothetical protein
MVQIYKLNATGRGKFILPSGAGGRRCGYGKPSRPSTNGKGLLLSSELGGFGVKSVPKQVGYISPPIIPTAFQHKLSGLNIRGSGLQKKMKTISFRM